MTRKGYCSEYTAKKILQLKYGHDNVLKVAIGQVGPDFLVMDRGSPALINIVEVKECHGNKFVFTKKIKEQVNRISEWCFRHDIPWWELWIHYPKKKKWEFRLYKSTRLQFS
jgi:hypothetical protein